MAIDFPDSPSVDQQYVVGDRAWTWNGDYWALTLTSSTFTASDDPPSGASAGDIWFESDTGKSFVYYDSFWVEIAGRAGSTTITGGGSNVSVSGTDGEIQFASNSELASSNTFVWDNANTQLTIGGDILANNVTANLNIIGNNITANANTTTNVIKTNTWQTATGNAAISLNDSGVISFSNDLTATFKSSHERWNIAATAATGTVDVDLSTASAWYYTTDASANWTFNFRGDASTTLNSVLGIGESITVAFIVTNGATAYYANAFQIDGTSVTPEWSDGTAPSSGNANSADSYLFTIIKTADATFTVFAQRNTFS